MKTDYTKVLALAAIALLWPGAAAAHHGTTQYDASKTITLNGTVTEFEWSNPHYLVHIDVKNDAGVVRRWVLELPSTFTMTHRGWNRDSIKTGDQAAIETHPARNGNPIGLSGTGSFLLKFVVNGKPLPGY